MNDRIKEVAANPLLKQSSISSVIAALGVLSVTGHAPALLSQPGTPQHLQLRNDPRRITFSAQLREAAEMARQGIPVVGTLAHAKIKAAEDAGDFAEANRLRQEVKNMAHAIEAAALEAKQGEAHAIIAQEREARVTLSVIDAARLKRARRAARNLRNTGVL